MRDAVERAIDKLKQFRRPRGAIPFAATRAGRVPSVALRIGWYRFATGVRIQITFQHTQKRPAA
jgi:hypothetical protein